MDKTMLRLWHLNRFDEVLCCFYVIVTSLFCFVFFFVWVHVLFSRSCIVCLLVR